MATAPPEPPAVAHRGAPPDRLLRFDRAERWLHWTNAALFGVLMATAAVLYIGQLSAIVGRRELVRVVHAWSGLLLPLPLIIAVAGPWRRRVLDDLSELNRFDADDRLWLRTRGRALPLPPGRRLRPRRPAQAVRLRKFNPGQKLNAAFVGGAIVVMLATGSTMYWFRFFPVDWRTGATFVHDWTALAVGLVVAGHLKMAFSDADALGAMVRGWVPAAWARRNRPRWYEAVTGEILPASPPDVGDYEVGGGGGDGDGRSIGP